MRRIIKKQLGTSQANKLLANRILVNQNYHLLQIHKSQFGRNSVKFKDLKV